MKARKFFIPFVLGILAWTPVQAAKESPTAVTGAVTIDTPKAKTLFDNGVPFVDVRKNADWNAGRIPGAKHVELKTVLNEAALVKVALKDKEIVFYCNGASCMRSSKAAKKAVEWGFKKVYYFRLGFPSWQAAGYPTE
jgi:rhodanese-related sulfurtransferase